MLEGVNVMWALGVGAFALVLGPTSGVWVGMRGIVAQMKQDRIETREWLKALQTEVYENKTAIAVEKAHRTSAEGG